jgi:hypothetical protein
MKNFTIRAVALCGLIAVVQPAVLAQFKASAANKPGVSESILRSDGSDFWFGLIDPSKFSMRHAFSLSYATFGGGRGMSLGMYTNSVYYKIADPLDVQFDVSLMYSPYSSGFAGPQKDFTGIYLTRAQLNYRPSESMLLQINFQQVPATSWMGWGYGRSPLYDFGLPRTQEGN